MSQVIRQTSKRWDRTTVVAWAAILVTGLTSGVARAGEPSKEYQVKAAFLFNFAQFVEWPEAAFPGKDAPLVIATLGADPFDGALDRAIAGKRVGGRTITVRHDPSGADESSAACTPVQIVFVPAAEDDRVAAELARVAGKPVLTVGETEAFMRAGGIIRFYLDDGRVRFEINPDAAARAGLKVSSKLLSLARIYKQQ